MPTPTSNEATNPTRICLFGGTFDPIHLGHTQIASEARTAMQLDQVIFLPCKQSPHKIDDRHAGTRDRLRMCQLATADLDWAQVDDFDLNSPEPNYSWRTAEAMQKRYPEAQLFWLMGTDQWDALPRWNRPEHLASLVEFIVYSRGNHAGPRKGYTMHAVHGNHPASATEIRASLSVNHPPEWLHPEVGQYIADHQLYQSTQ